MAKWENRAACNGEKRNWIYGNSTFFGTLLFQTIYIGKCLSSTHHFLSIFFCLLWNILCWTALVFPFHIHSTTWLRIRQIQILCFCVYGFVVGIAVAAAAAVAMILPARSFIIVVVIVCSLFGLLLFLNYAQFDNFAAAAATAVMAQKTHANLLSAKSEQERQREIQKGSEKYNIFFSAWAGLLSFSIYSTALESVDGQIITLLCSRISLKSRKYCLEWAKKCLYLCVPSVFNS